MRGRRPYLFSDTRIDSSPSLSREAFEYHLDTLTSRKQETQFEHFCRRLAEQEICPNLRPQTGPTGGGDAKVDSETYPVSDDISDRWFLGDREAGRERWAFAFSAKKDWKPKARHDVESILSTERDYACIYFITNQFAREKDRAKLEDELSSSARMPVKILDRAWIVEKVFDHNHISLAIEALGLTDVKSNQAETAGPLDVERRAELDALDAQIADTDRYQGMAYALAEDCFRAAILARGLGRIRVEVDGRFAQAGRIAEQAGFRQQQLRIAYKHAWTTYFWYDDFVRFSELYDQVEALTIGSHNASDLDMLATLYPLVRTAECYNFLNEENAKTDARRLRLVPELQRLAANAARPNNALEARAILLTVQMTDAAYENLPGQLDEVWEGFRQVLRDAEGLGTFSVERIFSAVSAIGEYVPESETFDHFFEEIIAILEVRKSEGAGGKAYVARAFQKAKKGLFYEAIRYFGRAVDRLLKEEYARDLAMALIGSSQAYESAGLNWAARTYALAATSHAVAAFERHGDLGEYVWRPLRRLAWMEAKLGRVPQFLASYEVEMVFRSQTAISQEQKAKLEDDRMSYGMLFGLLLLGARLSDLSDVARLPDNFERLGLPYARLALLKMLGHEDTLRAEGSIPPSEDESQVRDFFAEWDRQREEYEVADHPDFLLGERVEMRSILVGCEFVVSAINDPAAIAIAESFLGALESLLSTSLDHRMLPKVDRLEINVTSCGTNDGPPVLSFETTHGITRAAITHRGRLGFDSKEEIRAYSEWLHHSVIDVAVAAFSIFNAEKWVRQVLEKEKGFSRAITFSNVPLMTENVFGRIPKFSVAQWLVPEDTTYPLQHTEPENASLPQSPERKNAPTFGEGEPPPELMNTATLRHSDFRVISLIDVPRWEAARWGGAFFQYTSDVETYPPMLGLLFGEEEPARQIFEALKARLGDIDENAALRVAIIRGVSAASPHHYSVIVGSNHESPHTFESGRIVQFISRILRMTPAQPQNLNGFLEAYARSGRYLLLPAILCPKGKTPKILIDHAIGKYELHVRNAWEIGDNDPDMSALDIDDPPVIPADQPNAPALRTLERLKSFQKPT